MSEYGETALVRRARFTEHLTTPDNKGYKVGITLSMQGMSSGCPYFFVL